MIHNDMMKYSLCGRIKVYAALLLWGTGLLTGCTKDTAPPKTPQTVTKQDYGRLPFVVEDNYTFSEYYQALAATGYADTLAVNAGPYTILVPNNDGMAASHFYGNSTNWLLQASDPTTNDYVRYLIIPQKVSLAALPLGANQQFPTLEGTPVHITKYAENQGADTVITVNGIKVVANGIDLPASNGLIEVLSGVPEPQIYPNLWDRMLKDGSLVFFTTAIQRAGVQSLFETQGQFLTVLAPSNYAFTQIYVDSNGHSLDLTSIDKIEQADPTALKNLVLYHVMKGILFTNDFARADTLPYGDSVQLTMYNGETLNYHGQTFYSTGQVPGLENVLVPDPAGGNMWAYEHVGPLAPVSAMYWNEYYAGPPVVYTDRPAGNGVLQVIDGVLIP
jgi:uncharacterized surface protein with fasciclin (FAS1) repeats